MRSRDASWSTLAPVVRPAPRRGSAAEGLSIPDYCQTNRVALHDWPILSEPGILGFRYRRWHSLPDNAEELDRLML
jgi:hypothetical protein